MTESGLVREYRGLGANLLNTVQSRQAVSDPERGIRLSLVSAIGNVDRRFFAAKAFQSLKKDNLLFQVKVPQMIDGYQDLKRKFLELEKSFALKFYLRVKAAYSGRSGIVSLQPLSKNTRGVIPYNETGDLYANGVIYNSQKNSVYMSTERHPPRPKAEIGAYDDEDFFGGGENSTISYADIYFINEFGAPGLNIPARPVWRPILRGLLEETELEMKKILSETIS